MSIIYERLPFLKDDETECKTEGGAKKEDESRKLMKKPTPYADFFTGLFHAESGFYNKLGTLLNPFAQSGDFAEKRVSPEASGAVFWSLSCYKELKL